MTSLMYLEDDLNFKINNWLDEEVDNAEPCLLCSGRGNGNRMSPSLSSLILPRRLLNIQHSIASTETRPGHSKRGYAARGRAKIRRDKIEAIENETRPGHIEQASCNGMSSEDASFSPCSPAIPPSVKQHTLDWVNSTVEWNENRNLPDSASSTKSSMKTGFGSNQTGRGSLSERLALLDVTSLDQFPSLANKKNSETSTQAKPASTKTDMSMKSIASDLFNVSEPHDQPVCVVPKAKSSPKKKRSKKQSKQNGYLLRVTGPTPDSDQTLVLDLLESFGRILTSYTATEDSVYVVYARYESKEVCQNAQTCLDGKTSLFDDCTLRVSTV